MGSDSLV